MSFLFSRSGTPVADETSFLATARVRIKTTSAAHSNSLDFIECLYEKLR